jgi:hypothetical protein
VKFKKLTLNVCDKKKLFNKCIHISNFLKNTYPNQINLIKINNQFDKIKNNQFAKKLV